MKVKAFCCWSGGKETNLSLYKAMANQKIEVAFLLNMISEDGKHSRTHGVSSQLLKQQAELIGIPMVQRRTAWQTYENEFKKAVLGLKKEDIKAGVFGDIDLQEHRDWVERVCKDINIEPIFPLWQRQREEILTEFICSGFEAIVVAAKADFLDDGWVGRKVDKRFITDLKALGKVDLCGENGEYHTLVTGGPIFKKKIKILETKKIKRNNYWFLDILKYEIIAQS
ncbi:MAG: diphthine--ammonia ligase [Candidatus Omnitrophica bacterium]|nr:diphthine--ammonia ligase [Candidatus Omnitrophota bacterium]